MYININHFRLNHLQVEAGIMRIAAPIKRYWSEKYGLDFEKMSDASEYKEKHRLGMVNWSIEIRADSYGYFCYEAIQMANGKNIDVVST